MLVCIIGPGFLVHNVFKDNFGRARPHKIIEFNGIDKFTPAFVISDQCNKNCSFVSGHAAAGFMLFPLAFVLRKRNKRMMFYIASAVGILIGFARIAVGKHFLSDVLFAGIIVFAISYIFAKILKPIPPD